MRHLLKIWDNDRSIVMEVGSLVQMNAAAEMFTDKGMWVEVHVTDLYPSPLEVALCPMDNYRYGYVSKFKAGV